MELIDVCEACLRLEEATRTPAPMGRPPFSVIDGQCMRGHDMHRAGNRWRCSPCEAIYAERKRLRKATLRKEAAARSKKREQQLWEEVHP